MANLGLFNLFIAPPKGMWEGIISAFNSAFANYALAIIILTIIIKVVLLPTDYLNKSVSRKNMQMQTVLKPDLEAINKKYANDPTTKNQKTSELYKKNGYNMGGSCAIMLVNLVLTLVIFFTLFAGLNNMAAYKITYQYEQLEAVYNSSKTVSVEYANEQVALKYDEIKDGFLWIDNVWIADSPFKSSIPSFDEYKAIARQAEIAGEYKNWKDLSETELETVKNNYELVMNPLRENTSGVNGYFILAVLAGGASLLTQLITSKKLFRKKKDNFELKQQSVDVTAQTGNIMMYLMPILMAYIALSTNSVFALYIVVSQLVSTFSTPVIDAIQNKVDKKKAQKLYDEQIMKKGRISR